MPAAARARFLLEEGSGSSSWSTPPRLPRPRSRNWLPPPRGHLWRAIRLRFRDSACCKAVQRAVLSFRRNVGHPTAHYVINAQSEPRDYRAGKKKVDGCASVSTIGAMNNLIFTDKVPDPMVDELHDVTFFTKLHLRSDYYQVRIHPSEVETGVRHSPRLRFFFVFDCFNFLP